MAINFPSNPSTNDTHTVNNRVWQYDGEKWGVVGANLEPVVASLTVGGDFTVDSATLKVDSVNNRVGIGTTSPAAALDVAATGANAVHTHGQVRIDGTDPSRLTIGATDGSTNLWNIDNSNGLFRVFREDWAATGTGANGSTKLVITDTGNVGIGTSTPGETLSIATASGSAYIKQENGTATTYLGPDSSNTGLFGTSTAHDVRFITSNTERMRIDSSGNVGIGIATPTYVLETNSSSYQMARFESSGAEVNISLKSTSTGGRDYQIVSGGSGGGFAGGKFGIYDATGNALRFTIDSSGNVGIGTTTPGSPLAVSNPTLGTTAGNENALSELNSTSSNGAYLHTKLRRWSNGSDWTTAEWRIQETVDVTKHGYISFGNPAAGLSFGTANTERMRIDSSGDVAIGGTTAYYRLDVSGPEDTAMGVGISSGNTAHRYHIRFSRNGSLLAGGVYSDTSTASFGTPSDVNLKTGIETIPTSDALTALNQLRAVNYRYLLDTEDVVRKGFIAQEVEEVIPEAVQRVGGGHPATRLTLDENGDLQAEATDENGDPLVQEEPDILLTWEPITTTVVGAVQELSALVTTLTARIEALEAG